MWWPVLLLAFGWGVAWALVLQATEWGRWLALRRTWITVVVGVGVDLLLLLLVLPFEYWLQVALVVGLSSIGIVTRSLKNEYGDER